MNPRSKFFADWFDKHRAAFAILLSLILSVFFVLLGIYVFQEYGFALFLALPFFIGLSPTAILGYRQKITRGQGYKVSFLTLLFFCTTLLAFAIEGIICLVMAAPIGVFCVFVGSYCGYYLVSRHPDYSVKSLMFFILFIPALAFFEDTDTVPITSVTTEVEIEGSKEKVWEKVLVFPPLREPTEYLFQAGISYPVSSKIEGFGKGAIRYCEFNTGSFVEPITHWDSPNLLKFDVQEQPIPMRELSIWHVDAPHLHDFFVSVKGQFKLTTLENGNTLLQGKTWYYHKIRPHHYWKIWSDYIIHTIHRRVLNHIKEQVEKQ